MKSHLIFTGVAVGVLALSANVFAAGHGGGLGGGFGGGAGLGAGAGGAFGASSMGATQARAHAATQADIHASDSSVLNRSTTTVSGASNGGALAPNPGRIRRETARLHRQGPTHAANEAHAHANANAGLGPVTSTPPKP